MSVAHKFTFDLDLGRAPVNKKTMPADEFERAIAAARQEGYNQGLAEGQATSEARSASALAKAANQLADSTGLALSELDDQIQQFREEAVNLAASVARKLAAHLIARQPRAELTALIAECLSSLDHAPHLLIRCHPDLCEAMRTAAEERIKVSGFSGRLVVMGDPDIKLGDGRLEWADGGLVRDLNAISDEINTRISAYLAASGAKQGD